MKTKTLSITVLLFFALTFFAGTAKKAANEVTNQNPGISFTENKGQIHDQNYLPRPDVLFGAITKNMAVHIKRTGVSYQLYRVDRYNEIEDPKTKKKFKEIAQQTIYRVDLNWVNANSNVPTTQDEVLPGYNNYYLENCPNGALYVRSYKGVTLKNLYKGIDLHYYGKCGELKHDYIVAARADYRQIQVKVEGAQISVNGDGSLLLTTPLGKIQEGAPIVYQSGRQLNAKWKLTNNILSFEIENYNINYDLIIDPVTRLWGTYYGGNAEDAVGGCSKDNSGNVYLTGYAVSNSGTNIASSGSHQSAFGGFFDAFLVKFNISGVRLWGTYYGGTGSELGNSCSTDGSGNVFMAGNTSSTSGTVIASNASHQQTYGGGTRDAFLAKFDGNGIRQWGTYYGGALTDQGNWCVTDVNGNVYLAGNSNSTNASAIATGGSHQSVSGTTGDAFLVKFNSNGVRQWGTYYGGAGTDQGYACATDISGNVYLVGSTITSTNAIATVGSHQPVYGGGNYDGYLVKFSSNGVRQWGSYYGGLGDDIGYSCVTDASGNVYLAGFSDSNAGTALATGGSHQSLYGGGTYDSFLAKFDASGVRLWGTYYGGTGDDQGYSCDVDANNNVYLVGFTDTNSGTLIATSGSHQLLYGGGIYDGFLVKFNTNGIRQWGTYYGGAGDDGVYSCVTDNNSGLYLAGYTDSNIGTAIATVGSHQSNYGGGVYDAFLAKFDVCDVAPLQPTTILGNTSICSGSGLSSYSIVSVAGATSYTWSLPAGWSGSSNTNSISATPGGSGVFTVVAGNACGASPQQSLSVIVNPLPTITASSSSSVLCEGESATLTASGASTYTFNPGGTGTIIVVTPPVTSVYTISGTDANGCSNTIIFTQNVDACVGISQNPGIHPSCLKIYPNPNNGQFSLESHTEAQVLLIDLQGRMVGALSLAKGKNQISIEHLENGVYFLELSHPQGKEVFRIIKQ
jgi:hypothetical protein